MKKNNIALIVLIASLTACGGQDNSEHLWLPSGKGEARSDQTDQWGGYRHQYASGKLTDGYYIDAKPVLRGHGRQYLYVDLRSAPAEGAVNIWIRPEDAATIGDGFLTINVGTQGEKEQRLDAQLIHFYIDQDGQQQAMTASAVLDRFGSVYTERMDGWVAASLEQRSLMPNPGWAWGPWKLFVMRDDRSSPRVGGVLLNFPCHDGCPQEKNREKFVDLFSELGLFRPL